MILRHSVIACDHEGVAVERSEAGVDVGLVRVVMVKTGPRREILMLLPVWVSV